ncbi:tetratricopeptide repeat protein 17 isoform X2 [Microcaecilia unicolor]|uniref:Tetratricopeptide repeat protein 17 isoform X2 n=1 Tax=Microcaecilia unicolor TaxID=1415580 RepID=A0A6P7Y0U6_9AMPH|nr:tetratricopeptide repeat protein 17 isoform X2 [Microcaecilia unicolor]
MSLKGGKMVKNWELWCSGRGCCGCLLGVCLLLSLAPAGSATTHWMVTEDGKIQQQVDSPVNLKNPHDLVILMRQETTVNYLKELEKQLVAQKIHIEENEDRDTGLEQRHYKEDVDCLKAKVPLGDLDLYDGTYISLESKNLSPEDYIDTKLPLPPDLEKPDCTKIVELPYSIHAFQHLRGIQERINLSAPLLPKEDPIFSSLSKLLGKSIDDIGHKIHESLLKNTSSWVLYNMASFYWRIKNNPYQVVECAMRALHFSSRQNKDVALVNVANILHRAHFSADAAILAHAALDVTSDFLTNHYTLGNIYAMLGEYNHSVLCYDHALQTKPGFEQAVKRKHAVLCQQKLEQKLEAQHRSLQRTLNELKEYQKQHDHYLRQQEILEKHKLIQEEQILRNIIHETQMAKEAQLGNHQICRLGSQQHSLHCQWDLPVRYYRGDIFENVEYVQFGEDSSISDMSSVNLDLPTNQSDRNEAAQSPPVPHSILKVWGRESETFLNQQDMLWPRRPECAKTYPTIPAHEELPTYFLPPENRGLSGGPVMSKLGEAAAEPRTPDCSSVTSVHSNETLYQLIKDLDNKMNLKLKMPDGHARRVLFSQITSNTLTDDQIGELIFQSMEKSSKPLWLLLNEAGLYWRAVGNSTSAITCLRGSLSLAPEEHQDIPLVNLANLLIHYGFPLDASRLLLRALDINSSEPLTFLSLGNAYLALKNISGALHAFRQGLSLTMLCPDCESSLKLIRCMQLYPLLYNITTSTCFGHCQGTALERSHEQQKYLQVPEELVVTAIEEASLERGTTISHDAIEESSSLRLGNIVVAESNASDGQEDMGDPRMSEEMLALVDEFENTWPLEAFEGALEAKGCRMDLQGIRVLKKGSQDGVSGSCFGDCEDDDEAEWITFQVKRLKKPKTDSQDPQEPSVKTGKEAANSEIETHFQTALEISGPKILSPGPLGKKPDYRSLGWPSPDECLKLHRVELSTVASTWLGVSAKNIDITEHIDFVTQLQEPSIEPLCNANLAASMHTLDHLYGVSNRANIHYTGESQLKEVLQNLGKDKHPPQSFEQVGTRIAKVLEKNQTSWVLSSMAALYWRVKGQGKKAIDCLRQALHYAPHHMKEEFEKAMKWYESTLKLQPEFAPAKDRIRTIQCHLLLKKERQSP